MEFSLPIKMKISQVNGQINFLIKKTLGPDGFTDELKQKFK